MVNLASFWKSETCGQTVLKGQKNGGKSQYSKMQMQHFG